MIWILKSNKLVKQGEFKSFEDFLNALSIGATTKEEYLLVQYYRAPNYKIACEIRDRNLKSYQEYEFMLSLEKNKKILEH